MNGYFLKDFNNVSEENVDISDTLVWFLLSFYLYIVCIIKTLQLYASFIGLALLASCYSNSGQQGSIRELRNIVNQLMWCTDKSFLVK